MGFKFKKTSILPLLMMALLVFSQASARTVLAEEFVITGNGDSSNSTVTVAATTQTTVTQTNNADVQNNVDQNASTGDNTASNNTGGQIAVTTGDSTLNSSIENSFNNSSVDSSACCGGSGFSTIISGNGADSVNSIDLGITQGNNTYVTQNAFVSNYINGYVVTGRNSANDNTGSGVSITTGNIYAKGKIINGPINTSAVVSGNPQAQLSAVISDNGAGSTNNLTATFNDPQEVIITNNFEARNRTIWHLITGENQANGNTGGKVGIVTGNVFLDLWLENIANSSTVTIACCHTVHPDDPGDPGTPTPPSTPGTPGGGGGSGGGGGDSGGSSGPSVLGLSFTSSPSETGIVTIAGLAMMLAGFYVTFKNGKTQKLHLFF